jgi:hypothetical protein
MILSHRNEAHIVAGLHEYPEVRATKRILVKLLDIFSYRMGVLEKSIAERYFKKVIRDIETADEETRAKIYSALIEVHDIIKGDLKL